MRPPLDLRRFAPGVLLVLAGLVVLLAGGDGVTATAVAIALVGLGGVLAVSAAFWEIGASEDRARRPRRR
jgi:hypothetical protein